MRHGKPRDGAKPGPRASGAEGGDLPPGAVLLAEGREALVYDLDDPHHVAGTTSPTGRP